MYLVVPQSQVSRLVQVVLAVHAVLGDQVLREFLEVPVHRARPECPVIPHCLADPVNLWHPLIHVILAVPGVQADLTDLSGLAARADRSRLVVPSRPGLHVGQVAQ